MPVIAKTTSLRAGTILEKLQEINARQGYLPEEELRTAAHDLGVPLSQLYSVATFYSTFSLKPRGRHTIQICLGTACYIRGGEKLLDNLETITGVKRGETSDDRAFTLKPVHCVGSCSMSPVIRVDNDTYGRLNTKNIPRILKRYKLTGNNNDESE